MMDPRYRDVKAAEIPLVELEKGISIKVIAGAVGSVQGPVRDIVIEPEMLDICVPAGIMYEHILPEGHTAFAYILDGEGTFDETGNVYQKETVLLFEREGKKVKIVAGETSLRILFVAGKPLGESVAWGGPIVMNTQEELHAAFEEYNNGTFIKH
jgi:redox-sensitive bicupin YhaK (pirin superfamily)